MRKKFCETIIQRNLPVNWPPRACNSRLLDFSYGAMRSHCAVPTNYGQLMHCMTTLNVFLLKYSLIYVRKSSKVGSTEFKPWNEDAAVTWIILYSMHNGIKYTLHWLKKLIEIEYSSCFISILSSSALIGRPCIRSWRWWWWITSWCPIHCKKKAPWWTEKPF